jgi:hypothetical protein
MDERRAEPFGPGQPVGSFRKAWANACLAVGLAQLVSEKPRLIETARIMHDLRGTAVRNLERAAVPRSVTMQLVGHKTEAIYRRYAIVTESDLSDGVARLGRPHAAEADAQRQVIPPRRQQAGGGSAKN